MGRGQGKRAQRRVCTSFSNGNEANLCTEVKPISNMGEKLIRMAGRAEIKISLLVMNMLWKNSSPF